MSGRSSSRAGGSSSAPTADASTSSGPSLKIDPQLVEKIIEELKSQGTFDQFRKDCLAEVDTKPAFQNLRQRVEIDLDKFLAKENDKWNPNMNKNQLRNKLRKYLQTSNYMDDGIERIVDQVVNPKVFSVIKPDVEEVIYSQLGIDKPDPNKPQEPQNGGVKISPKEEKEVVMSSEDVEMKSEDESMKMKEETFNEPLSSPDLKGNISPLTPEKESPKTPKKGDVSPLTPPERREEVKSPHTPPLPIEPTKQPAPQDMVIDDGNGVSYQEEVVGGEDKDMSPVSDAELDDKTPPKQSPVTPSECSLPTPPGVATRSFTPPLPPPPPPPPSAPAPGPPPPPPKSQSPVTSPIGSSSSEFGSPAPSSRQSQKGKSVSGPSDISDTELPEDISSSASSEELERMKEKIRAKLEQTELMDEERETAMSNYEEKLKEDDSDGEIRSNVSEDDSDDYVKKFNEILSGGGNIKIDETEKVDEDLEKEFGHSDSDKEKEEREVITPEPPLKEKDPKEEDDPDPDGGCSGTKGSSSMNKKGQETNSNHETQDASSNSKESNKDQKFQEDKKSHKKSENKSHNKHHYDKKEHSHSRKHNHKHKSSRHASRRETKSSSESKDGQTSSSKTKSKESQERRSSIDKKTIDKKEKRNAEKETFEKIQKIEKKIREKSHLKSEKFRDFDMFAPKPPKPKVPPFGVQRPPSSSSSASLSPQSVGMKSPQTYSMKSPLVSLSSPKQSSIMDSKDKGGKRVHLNDESQIKRERRQSQDRKTVVIQEKDDKPKRLNDSFIVTSSVERKQFPELTVSRIDGDKQKQHEDDILQAKRRLEEARQKKLEELKKIEAEKKRKRTHSQGSKSKKPNLKRRISSSGDKSPKTPKLQDEDESSDFSNEEIPNLQKRNRKKKEAVIDSSEDEEEPKRDRKIFSSKKRAAQEETDDPDLHGFSEEDVSIALLMANELSSFLEDEDNISVSSVSSDELNEKICFTDLEDPETCAKILAQYGGNPKIVPSPPAWLLKLIADWNLTRDQVEIHIDDPNFRPKKVISEEEFSRHLNDKIFSQEKDHGLVEENEEAFDSKDHSKNTQYGDGSNDQSDLDFHGFEENTELPIEDLRREIASIETMWQGETFGMEIMSPFLTNDYYEDDIKEIEGVISVEVPETFQNKTLVQNNSENISSQKFQLPPSPVSYKSDGSNSPGSSKDNSQNTVSGITSVLESSETVLQSGKSTRRSSRRFAKTDVQSKVQ